MYVFPIMLGCILSKAKKAYWILQNVTAAVLDGKEIHTHHKE